MALRALVNPKTILQNTNISFMAHKKYSIVMIFFEVKRHQKNF